MMLVQEYIGDSFRTLRADKLSAAILELCREGGREEAAQAQEKSAVKKQGEDHD